MILNFCSRNIRFNLWIRLFIYIEFFTWFLGTAHTYSSVLFTLKIMPGSFLEYISVPKLHWQCLPWSWSIPEAVFSIFEAIKVAWSLVERLGRLPDLVNSIFGQKLLNKVRRVSRCIIMPNTCGVKTGGSNFSSDLMRALRTKWSSILMFLN